MKQFIVLIAVLPIMLLFLLQFTLEQKNSLAIGRIQDITYAAKEEAKLQASKIIADAQASIQHQKMAALTEIKNTVGNMVIEISEKVLQKELSDKSAQEQYINHLAQDLALN